MTGATLSVSISWSWWAKPVLFLAFTLSALFKSDALLDASAAFVTKHGMKVKAQ